MSSNPYFGNDVVIVARGCVLPGARTPEDFWSICINQTSQIKEISHERLKHYFSRHIASSSEKIPLAMGGEISHDDYDYYKKKNSLAPDEANRLSAYLNESLSQVCTELKPQPAGSRKDLILGCMNPDADFELETLNANRGVYRTRLSKALGDQAFDEKIGSQIVDRALDSVSADIYQAENNFYASRCLSMATKRFDINGEFFLLDAACASSLAAIEAGMDRLKLYQTDVVFAGGIESNLGYGSYLAFGTVGALARFGSKPFDQSSDGITQGEGAVIFALKRLEDAQKNGDHIYAVIRGAAGSSDGRSASLFQPNVNGQNIVYGKIYDDNRTLSYIEAHGTGTPVGDRTEMESLSTFFKDQKIPVGSCKSLIGHTKGTAGAAGVLKSLFIMNEKKIPGSGYLVEQVLATPSGPYVNQSEIALGDDEIIRVGINAFGFGGTNYHTLLERYDPAALIKPALISEKVSLVCVAESKIDLSDFTTESFVSHELPFRLPPKVVSSIDLVQLAGLLGSWMCIKSLGKQWNFLPRKKINVVSSCTLFLDQIFHSIHRLAYELIHLGFEDELPGGQPNAVVRTFIDDVIDKIYPRMNEDSATGVLNNVIAGRVCNAFDIYGKSYNVDKDLASNVMALQSISNSLQLNPDQMFIHIDVNESHDETAKKSKRESVVVRILTSPAFAAENELNLKSQIELTERKSQ